MPAGGRNEQQRRRQRPIIQPLDRACRPQDPRPGDHLHGLLPRSRSWSLCSWAGTYSRRWAPAGSQSATRSCRCTSPSTFAGSSTTPCCGTGWLSATECSAVILVVMLAIGVAEHSGLFAALIKRIGTHIPQAWLPLLLMFLGITSSVATDAGYLVLIPLAGLLYAGIGRNPLIGMAAAFAGVSAGFSANLIPGTPVDVIIGMNAQVFAESQGIPFTTAGGALLRPATMNYWFIATSTVVLALTGAWVTRRFVEPKLDQQPFELPAAIRLDEFEVTAAEHKGLGAAGWGLLVAALVPSADCRWGRSAHTPTSADGTAGAPVSQQHHPADRPVLHHRGRVLRLCLGQLQAGRGCGPGHGEADEHHGVHPGADLFQLQLPWPA
jgi:hypothetical protein